jgi:hypothetical protein
MSDNNTQAPAVSLTDRIEQRLTAVRSEGTTARADRTRLLLKWASWAQEDSTDRMDATDNGANHADRDKTRNDVLSRYADAMSAALGTAWRLKDAQELLRIHGMLALLSDDIAAKASTIAYEALRVLARWAAYSENDEAYRLRAKLTDDIIVDPTTRLSALIESLASSPKAPADLRNLLDSHESEMLDAERKAMTDRNRKALEGKMIMAERSKLLRERQTFIQSIMSRSAKLGFSPAALTDELIRAEAIELPSESIGDPSQWSADDADTIATMLIDSPDPEALHTLCRRLAPIILQSANGKSVGNATRTTNDRPIESITRTVNEPALSATG